MSLSTATASSPNPWLQVLDALEKKVNRLSYETWLKPTRFDHAQGNKIFVRVPTPEFRLIGEKYADLIQEALDGLGLGFEDVEFVTDDPPAEPPMRHDGGSAAVHATLLRPRADSRHVSTGTVPHNSIRNTPSRTSSSAPATSLRTRPARPSPSGPRRPTTRSSSMAAWVWARPT